VRQGAKVLLSPIVLREKRSKIDMPIIRVLVVEDYEPMRRTIRATLLERRDVQVVGEASDGLEAVQKAVELRPDLILMDIGLPSLNGIEAARQIRNLVPEAKILYLSQETSPEVIQEALRVSASGYVVKINAGLQLFPAIDAAISGEQFASQI
jgi:DNA-binding NarL/FixJ family response regulator